MNSQSSLATNSQSSLPTNSQIYEAEAEFLGQDEEEQENYDVVSAVQQINADIHMIHDEFVRVNENIQQLNDNFEQSVTDIIQFMDTMSQQMTTGFARITALLESRQPSSVGIASVLPQKASAAPTAAVEDGPGEAAVAVANIGLNVLEKIDTVEKLDKFNERIVEEAVSTAYVSHHTMNMI